MSNASTQILIVANRSMQGEALARAVEDRLASGPCEFTVLVPVGTTVSPVVALGAAAGEMTPTAYFDMEGEREAAQERLDAALAWCADRHVMAEGVLSIDSDVVSAVRELVATNRFDEIIVSTLPTTVSRWLRQDLPHRIERKVAIPVTVVTPS